MSNGIFSSFHVSASGLRAQRLRLDVAAENLANIETTRTQAGEPYRPKKVVFEATRSDPVALPDGPDSFQALLDENAQATGTEVPRAAAETKPAAFVQARVANVETPFRSEYDPDHPDADAEGMVRKPNVDPIQEMLTLMMATRAYEANATALDAAKDMLNRALEI